MSTEVVSKGLSVIAATMMKLSQNLYAETLLKTIGEHASGLGIDGGWPCGRRFDARELGSGCRRSLSTSMDPGFHVTTWSPPDALATVLRHVYQDERLRDPFIGTLPRAGVDGTLGERMKGTAAADNVRAKTGSFSNARSVAGYVRTADGEPLEFVVIANNYGAPAEASSTTPRTRSSSRWRSSPDSSADLRSAVHGRPQGLHYDC